MQIDFNKSITENKKNLNRPFFVAHRGVNCANIPCNTLLAYKIAVDQGAEVVEIDITKSKDGEYFVFHPGMEPAFIKTGKFIPEMTKEEVKQLKLLNLDEVPTHYTIPTLKEVLSLLRDKTYINVDKFWMDVEGISKVIRECGTEKQVIVKTNADEKSFEQVEKFASDFMYMTMAWHRDEITDSLLKRNLKFIGIEALFDKLSDDICSKSYIESMHKNGLLVWSNSIVYNEKDVISAGLTDDISLEKGGDSGWGKLIDMNFDFIQTDWLLALKNYTEQKIK